MGFQLVFNLDSHKSQHKGLLMATWFPHATRSNAACPGLMSPVGVNNRQLILVAQFPTLVVS